MEDLLVKISKCYLPLNQLKYANSVELIGKGISHPQPCTLFDRRASLENIFEADSMGLEIAASALIRQKVSNSPNNISTIQLATGGHSMTLSKPGSSLHTKKGLFQDIPIPASEFSHLKTVCKLSNLQAKKTAKFVRSWKGRDAIESGALDKLSDDDKALVNFFTAKKCLMDSSNKTERMDGKKVERNLVYCHNLTGLIDYICQHRKLSEEDRYYIKIGIDGGGSFLKVCFNLEKYDNFTSQVNQNKKWSYAAGAYSKKFKDSGVNKLMILGIVEEVYENYDNLKTVLDHIDFEFFKNVNTHMHLI